MSSILTKKYRGFLAKEFLNAFANTSQYVYAFIGRPQNWVDAANGSVSDTNPPVPVNDVQHQTFENWRDMLGIKRIPEANTYLVVPRRNWATNTAYIQYDDTDADLFSKAFYVLDTTSAPLKVYKCLWNNANAASTIAPSTIGTNVDPQTTGDGYVWQYMYTIGTDLFTFLTSAWMPVLANSTVQSNANTYAGRLPIAVPLVITNGGAGYNVAVTTVDTLIGDGSGATIVNTGVTITAGAVTKVLLSTGGLGYSNVQTINIYQAGATTAVLRAIIPPYPNHGYDPVMELGTAAVMATTQFEFSESGGLTVTNNYRRVGVIVNPLLANGNAANANFYKQTTDCIVSSNTGVFAPDDVIFNETNAANTTAIVVDVQPNGNAVPVLRLTYVNDKGQTAPFSPGDVLMCNATGVEYTIGVINSPALTFFTGDILYCDQRVPITRANDQVEEIKLVFQLG
jgi:hypothetical protein